MMYVGNKLTGGGVGGAVGAPKGVNSKSTQKLVLETKMPGN